MNLCIDLQKRLSANFALDVKFSIPEGITMLFGASGSGKTTLLRCVAGLLRPESGRITIGDEILFDSKARLNIPVRQRRIGFLFQNLALFPHLNVMKNVEYGLDGRSRTDAQQRIENVVRMFGISGLRNQKPNDISGGERQRVALARALVTQPRVLMLDEPLSALDYPTQSQIIQDLRAWNVAQQIPILYVTHSQREVFALGDRVVLLQDGKILSQGTPQDVLEAPAYESIAQLAGFENIFDAIVLSLNMDSGTMLCRLDGAKTEVEVPLSRAKVDSKIRIAIRAGDILIAGEFPRALSARNVLPARIVSLRRESSMIIAEMDAGRIFEVHLTPGASESLGLRPGEQVWLVIKTHSWRLVAAKIPSAHEL